ncbi:MAG: nitrous oxide reductase accessory protein NosL [Paracoccaceae bacterium]
MRKLLLIAVWFVAACRDDAVPPPPVSMTETAVGFYCQMELEEHPGPKAQVHLKDVSAPLFFAQVRDALAYQRMPEQSHEIAATYVSDMDRAPSWADPGEDNWIAAKDAYYVVGSDRAGGMGAAETVPFASPDGARDFANAHGGQVMRMTDIPDDALLAPADTGPATGDADDDYAERLRALMQKDAP